MPGLHLFEMWDVLSLEYKKVALSEIASVVVQFSLVKFDRIGSL